MSLLDKLKSVFSGGSSADADPQAGHDHSAGGHSHDDELVEAPEPETLPPDPAAERESTPE